LRVSGCSGMFQKERTQALLDSGVMGNFIHPRYVQERSLITMKRVPLTINNVNRHLLTQVDRQVKLDLLIGEHYETIIFDVTPLGGHNMVLGLPWLHRHNPQVNWEEVKLLFSLSYCLGSCVEGKAEIALETDGKGLGIIEMSEDEVRIYSVDFKAEFLEDPRELKKQVPEPYWDYLAIFDSGRAMAKLPPLRGGDGDFGIQFVEGAELPRPAKPYPLSQRELGVLDKWLKRLEEVRAVVPAPVDCPIAAPLFFVPKKEGTL
jgi:hypothetical protein